jgi:hypothetical protein
VIRADAERWLSRFDAAERATREHRRREGPRPEWSLDLALSLIDAAREAGTPPDPRRARDEAAVRETWARLRAARR